MCPAHSLCYYHGHSAELGASRIVHGVLSGEWGILMNIYVLTVAEAPFHFYWDEPNECLWISFACVGIYILSGCFFFFADPPSVTVQLESNIDLGTVKEGDDVLLSCEVRANPQPESNAVTWYHGVSSKCFL